MEKRDSGARKSLFLLPLLPGDPVPCLPSICSDDGKHLSSWALHLTGSQATFCPGLRQLLAQPCTPPPRRAEGLGGPRGNLLSKLELGKRQASL